MIFTDSPDVNPNLTLDDLPGTFGGAVDASARSALYNSPVMQITRTVQDANAGGAMLDYETARTKSRAAGVDVRIDPKGMSEGALDLLIERKRFQAQTQDALARGPHGFAAGSAYFLTGLGAAMLDPINVASAFIPVARGIGMAEDVARAGALGEAGAAATATGRAAARLRVGAVEGGVGQAMLEPLTAFRASKEQEDYGITDTLLNVGFGTVLGAVAHTGLGALGDRAVAAERSKKASELVGAAAKLHAADMETNSAVFRSEIAAAADGRKMDNGVLVADIPKTYIDTPLKTNDGQEFSIRRAGERTNPRFEAVDAQGNLLGHSYDLSGQPGSTDIFITAEGWKGKGVGHALYEASRESAGGDLRPSENLSGDAVKYWKRRDPAALEKMISDSADATIKSGRKYGHSDEAIIQMEREYANETPLNAEVAAAVEAKLKGEKWTPDWSKETHPTEVAASAEPIDPLKVQSAAAASHLPENDVHYDAQAKAEVDAAVKEHAADVDPAEAVTRATQEAQTELATLSKQLGLDPEKNAAMRGADDLASTASRYSKAIEAYASCQVRS